ncbi:50S ribosomal protein L23 [Nitrospira sp.]|nr:50S ribosomal protein L23 [Nitrospira sp.]
MSIENGRILLRPLLTEKVTALRESQNTVAFVVAAKANRIQVKRAVEEMLKVKVDRVNLMNVMGKFKRLGRFGGKKPDWKKALVTLKKGEKLELYETV